MNSSLRRLVVLAALGAAFVSIALDPAVGQTGVDETVRPGDDFFAYANGGWLKATAIPAGKERWNARTEIDEVTRPRVGELLEAAATAPAGSFARKAADYRAAYLNEAAVEARGLTSVQPLLERINGVTDKAGLTRVLGAGMRADVDPLNWGVYRSASLLGLSVEPGINGEKTYVAFLLQGGLGLPERENYLSTEPGLVALRATYRDYVARMLALAGFDRPAERAEAVVALETAIAQTQATPEASAVDRNTDNLWARADFARLAPGMDWTEFFTAAGLAKQEAFVAWQPTAVKGVAALVASQPLAAWQDYLRFQVLDRYADVLPRVFAEQAQALHGAADGQPTPAPRAERALAATQAAMSEAIGRMYAERYFPAEYKARVGTIVTNVIAAFRRRVETVPWMTPATRKLALGKLDALRFEVGYPDTWQDYSDLDVDPVDAAGNLRRIGDRNYRRALARLGQPVDMGEWWIAPQMVGALLVFQQNAYNFPAGLLQAPKFDPAAPEAMNYGAIGAIAGHEISHFIDTLGAEYEAGGRLRNWWTPADVAGFQAATEPLIKQFGGYHPFPDMTINGKLTLTENVADLAGLSSAFEAYRLTLGDRIADKAYVRQQDRLFFIGFARGWRSKATEAALRKQVASNDHAPEMYRVATVRNLDAWYEAFDVQPGQGLYLEPKARVRVW